jgi:hypothetical protein
MRPRAHYWHWFGLGITAEVFDIENQHRKSAVVNFIKNHETNQF